MFDGPDYQLAWPRELFVAEASALSFGPNADMNRAECLLAEAFVSSTPVEDFKAAPAHVRELTFGDDPWATASPVADPNSAPIPSQRVVAKSDFLAELIGRADSLPEASTPRPYWPERIAGGDGSSRQPLSLQATKWRFAQFATELQRRGYLEKTFPRRCVDDGDDITTDESSTLQELLGVPHLWPLQPDLWDENLFYGLLEVFHDLVARPRDRWRHDYGGCGWHYSAFVIGPARHLYRWRINKILTDADIPLRLAEDGEDTGRLVRLVDDARSVLVEQTIRSPDSKVADQVRHAIALFRGRTATVQDKRSAVVALAHVLERRRQLLKAELLRGDEGALFRIAKRVRDPARKPPADGQLRSGVPGLGFLVVSRHH